MGKYQAGNYIFRINNRNTRTRCEICSNLTIKTPERHHLVSLLLTLNIFRTFFYCLLATLNKYMFGGTGIKGIKYTIFIGHSRHSMPQRNYHLTWKMVCCYGLIKSIIVIQKIIQTIHQLNVIIAIKRKPTAFTKTTLQKNKYFLHQQI